MRDILRRAEVFFRKDAQDTRKQEQETQIPELQERLRVLEQELEIAQNEIGWIPDELGQKYEEVQLELDTILHGHMQGEEISPEWTALQQALHGSHPSETPNLRLVIDAIDRLKAEGVWDESLLDEDVLAQQAAK